MFPSVAADLANTKVTTDLKFNKPVLKKGFRKVEVLELRKLLAHWNVDIDSGSNVFDAPLETAVKKFQRRVFLQADGVVGPCTWHALHTGSPTDMPVLKLGSKGDAVKQLQITLNSAGIDLTEVDGNFGLPTEIAVRTFQRRKGLVVDGVVDCATWRALSRVCR